MGFFDDEKVYVDVISNKLTDNKATPIKNGIISAVMRDTGVADGILAGMINGLGPRAHRYYKRGADPVKWPGGLPVVEVGLIREDADPYDTTPYPGTFYPVVTLRENKTFLTEETEWSPDLHKNSKRLLRRIALNVDDLVGAVEEDNRENEDGTPVEGENPSDDIDDVFYLFGLDLYTQEEHSAEYMYDFWENTEPVIKQDWDAFQQGILDFQEGGLSGEILSIPSNVISFQGASQHTLHYVFDAMTRDEISGTLLDEEGKKIDASAEIVKGGIRRYEYNPENSTVYYYIDSSYAEYRKQISDGVIGVIQIHGLHHETIVDAYGEKNAVVRTISDPSQAEEVPPVEPEVPSAVVAEQPAAAAAEFGETGTYDTYFGLEPGDPDFGRSGIYMPLCKEVLELQHTIQEEEVLVDAMMLIMHAAQEVELKWYQQGWFKIVMVIIVAIIIYFSVGTLIKEAVTLLDFAMALFTQYAISYVLDLLFKTLGGELALVLGTALAIWGATRGDFSKVKNLFPNAKELLQATRVTMQVAKAKIKNDMEDLKLEIKDFTEEAEDRIRQLKEAQDLLGDSNNDYDLLWLTRETRIDMHSNASAFYARCKPDSINMAGVVKNQTYEYHSTMKRLDRVHRDTSYQTA